jgi:MFS family permease
VLPEQLATANALEMLSYTIAGVIGPVLAGVLISLIGAPGVVALDALSYVVFALLLLRMRPIDPGRASAAGVRYTLGDAVRLLLTQPILSSTTAMFLVFNIGGGMLAVALPILVDQVIGGGPQLYGTLLGIQAGGEVLSAILAGSLTLRLSLGARICVAQALAGAVLLLVLTPQVWVIAIGLALFGLCSAPLTIWAQTLRMQVIPLELRGRAFALLRMLMQSGNPLGGALAGGMLPLLGSTILLAIAAGLVGLPGVLGAAVPELRRAGLVK